MRPTDLQATDFAAYPPQAKVVATREIQLLRALPIAFLPLLLRELIDYDWKFPAERAELDHQFSYLDSKTATQVSALMQPFAGLKVSADLLQFDWVNDPVQFSEKLSANLWASQQMEAFRKASIEYVHQVAVARAEPKLAAARVSVLLVGQGVTETKYPLFRKLREHGVHYTNVLPDGGYASALEFVATRAQQHPAPFAHWYVDGGKAAGQPQGVSVVSYLSLEPARAKLIDKMIQTMKPGGGGPERLRTDLARMQPAEVGLPGNGDDALLSRFKLALLTQGSGTQMFSTTFVQWTAREVLRRAQPLTLFARYAPRQSEPAVRPPGSNPAATDPAASLVDADMGAYYTWINQQRLTGAADSRFLVWFEEHREAFSSAPSLGRGETNDKPVPIRELINQLA